MFKRIFNTSSPLGIAITVAGVILALSPEARKSTRRMLVKGTAAILGMVDQVKDITAHMKSEPAGSSHTFENVSLPFEEGKASGESHGGNGNSPSYH